MITLAPDQFQQVLSRPLGPGNVLNFYADPFRDERLETRARKGKGREVPGSTAAEATENEGSERGNAVPRITIAKGTELKITDGTELAIAEGTGLVIEEGAGLAIADGGELVIGGKGNEVDQPMTPNGTDGEAASGSRTSLLEAKEILQRTMLESKKESQTSTPEATESEIDHDDVDWTKYEPPAALRKAPNITSEIILEIVRVSIENLKTQIADNERRQKRREEDERRRAAAEAAEQDGKEKEPYLPIIMVQDVPEPEDDEPTHHDKGKGKETTDGLLPSPTSGQGLVLFPVKAPKRHRFALARLFQRSHGDPDRGESSSAAQKRSFFRQYHQRTISAPEAAINASAKESHSVFNVLARTKTPEPDELV
jgi:hypothetical protein